MKDVSVGILGGRKTIVSNVLKFGATVLDCPSLKGTLIDRVDTRSLQAGRANALSLAGYNGREIQKWAADGEDLQIVH